MRKDFNPLLGNAQALIKLLDEWRQGKAEASAVAALIDRSIPQFAQSATALRARKPLAGALKALKDYQFSVALYLEAIRIERIATTLPKGELQAQLQRAYARLRLLGDRMFDQASVELTAFLPPVQEQEGIEIGKVADVPDWASLELAPGPPLDEPAAKTPLRDYQKTRAEQAFPAWAAKVRATVPPVAELSAAVRSGDADSCGALARKLTSASVELLNAPDPQGERAVSTRLQLGLLIDAEAARSAQAAALLSGAPAMALRTSAMRLALIGEGLWDTRLGARSTGFPPALLIS